LEGPLDERPWHILRHYDCDARVKQWLRLDRISAKFLEGNREDAKLKVFEGCSSVDEFLKMIDGINETLPEMGEILQFKTEENKAFGKTKKVIF
jgi:hypothetical protein